ncbi:conserved hypothetical protein [Clostridium neonatale]|uniref:hypothetical protein n=1 Tax=Clostridium neonatale TaxID=137838 RepID=UPI001D9C0B7A|nr:hypothetical protein [Clostridium neonatale]CAG9714688.1 hypothetical protein CNEO_2490006 [Clostridium neonatale]CAI3535179.1 conserved hypothetical protein [Clostridium neonatale]CAI3549776.1 conserved hypothetical protein [Clostridium neonatale]CAI3551999.1 conserved hypothetical protein [Clostridium neonatale]CAI3553010.1 conserved hypothetical protein [Clostridium neonatale]
MSNYRKIAEKTRALTETLEALADMEEREANGEVVSDDEGLLLLGKFTALLMDLQKGI